MHTARHKCHGNDDVMHSHSDINLTYLRSDNDTVRVFLNAVFSTAGEDCIPWIEMNCMLRGWWEWTERRGGRIKSSLRNHNMGNMIS